MYEEELVVGGSRMIFSQCREEWMKSIIMI